MVRRANECKFSVREQMKGGPGAAEQTEFVFKEEMYDKARLFGKIVLKAGCGIGYHVHEDESEYFYIAAGAGEYDDNGTKVQVSAGDVVICKDGEGHAVTNTGEEDLVLIAAIVLK